MNLRFVRFVDGYVGITLAYLFHLGRFILRQFGLEARRGVGSPGKSDRAREGAVPRRILLIKFWGVGNVLMLLPAVRAIRATWPQARVDLLTLEQNLEIAQMTGLFGRCHSVHNQTLRGFLSTLVRVFFALARARYDLIVDFEQFARISALLTACLGCGKTVGFHTAGQHRHFLFTETMPYDNTIHMTRSFLNLAEHAGARADAKAVMPGGLRFPAAIVEKMKSLFPSAFAAREVGRPLVVMHVGTSENFNLRRWPPEFFAALGDRLIAGHQATLILTGLENEAHLATTCCREMKHGETVINACGKLSLPELGALIAEADLLVSADTSPVHFASALDKPCVGLYGPNTPLLYGPWGAHGLAFYRPPACSPCITNFNAKIAVCRHPEGNGHCMRVLSPDEVYVGITERFLHS